MTYYPTGLTVIDTSAILKPIVVPVPPRPPPPPKTIRYPTQFGRRGVQRSLGDACCANCAQSAMGATQATRAASLLQASPQAQATVIPGTLPSGVSGTSAVVKLALLAGLAAGGYFLVKKLRAKKAA